MELDDVLKILILRTLGLTQEEVAERLHRARQTVGDAEQWFIDCRQGDASALLDDYRIKRLIAREFLGIGLKDDQLIRAGQITGDDILLHYGRVLPSETGEAAADIEPVIPVSPVYVKLLTTHWRLLRQLAITFRTQLTPPGTDQLFTAEVCRRAYQARQSGVTLLSPTSWTTVIEAPLELRLSPGTARKRTVEARLPVEAEVLFPHLVAHLKAEPGGFPRFRAWKTWLGRLVEICLESAADLTQRYRDAARMYYQGDRRQRGLFFRCADYIGQFVLNHPPEAVPVFATEPQSEGL
ncbi:MAG TPA: hypothetical protein G4O09_01225, partial [Dehalococcoidia bacterium]|nr:hypothetical protein [Dehalococcoidia bacterium]